VSQIPVSKREYEDAIADAFMRGVIWCEENPKERLADIQHAAQCYADKWVNGVLPAPKALPSPPGDA